MDDTAKLLQALNITQVAPEHLPDLCGSVGTKGAILVSAQGYGDEVVLKLDRYDTQHGYVMSYDETTSRVSMLRILRTKSAQMVAQLDATKLPAQRKLGITMTEISSEERARGGLSEPSGAQVVRVQPGSAGEIAGVRAGDVLLEVGGRMLRHHQELSSLLLKCSPRAPVALVLWRDGARIEVRAWDVQETEPNVEKLPAEY